MALEWFGDRVKDRVRAAAKSGVNATMAAAAIHAKRNHPWMNRTGVLEGSVGIIDYATDVTGGVRGTWGSADVLYAIHQELGTSRIPARPYLRPAADATYGELAARIRAAFEGRL